MNEINAMYEYMGISPKVYAYGESTIERLKERFAAIELSAEEEFALPNIDAE